MEEVWVVWERLGVGIKDEEWREGGRVRSCGDSSLAEVMSIGIRSFFAGCIREQWALFALWKFSMPLFFR